MQYKIKKVIKYLVTIHGTNIRLSYLHVKPVLNMASAGQCSLFASVVSRPSLGLPDGSVRRSEPCMGRASWPAAYNLDDTSIK